MDKVRVHHLKYNMHQFRKDFIYGLLVVIPLATILWIIDLSTQIITGPVSQIIGIELNTINGLIISLIILWGIGFGIRQLVNRSIFPKIETILLKIPIIKLLYNSVKQIAKLVLKKKQRFLATVFIEYPSPNIWSLGLSIGKNIDRKTFGRILLRPKSFSAEILFGRKLLRRNYFFVFFVTVTHPPSDRMG